MTLQGAQVALRPATVEDVPELARIRATPEPEALAVAMRLAGDDGVRRDTDGGLLLTLPADRAPDVTRALVGAGVDVHEITAAERSLEEVFFEMTSQKEAVR